MSKPQPRSTSQFRADRPEEQDAVRTTIVGGRPPGSGKPVGDIPCGIEVLVKKAAVDESFRELLLEKRAEAARRIGLGLEPAEALMLAAAPREQLLTIIQNTVVPQAQRRAFLGTAAAAMLTAMGLVVVGCDGGPQPAGIRPEEGPPPVKGIRPDKPKKKSDSTGETGIRPDTGPKDGDGDGPLEPPPDLDQQTRGIRPDRPEPKPKPPEETDDFPAVTLGIRPNR